MSARGWPLPDTAGLRIASLLLWASLACSACFADETPPPSRSQAAAQVEDMTEPPPMPPSTPPVSTKVWLPELEQGSFAVGYRQQWFEDPTRSVLDPQTGAHHKRPILLSVWYPSEAGSGEGMRVDDYLRVDVDAAGAWRERLERHVGRVREQEVFGGQPSAALAKLSTTARRDASWASGSFPLVLAHPGLGGSFSDNFVLWEHLASHGFVVVSGAFLDASGLSSAIDWDPATSIADFDRMYEAAATWPGVDARRTVVVGHSYGGQAALAYAMAGRDLLAVISLDSTIEYADPQDPWYEQPEPARHLGRRDALRIPVLVFHAGGQTAYVESLRHSERTIVALPGLAHNDFITHGGVLRAEYIEPGDPQARARYAQIAADVRRFLQSVTEGKPTDAPLPSAWTRLPAVEPAPDLAQVVAWIRELGPAGAWQRCAARDDCAAEPLVNDAGYVLMRVGEPALAEGVFATVVERVPDSWNAWDSWAEAAAERGDDAAAIERYRKALELVRAVEPPQPAHAVRIEGRLAELESSE